MPPTDLTRQSSRFSRQFRGRNCRVAADDAANAAATGVVGAIVNAGDFSFVVSFSIVFAVTCNTQVGKEPQSNSIKR